jgi:hypothetical protein
MIGARKVPREIFEPLCTLRTLCVECTPVDDRNPGRRDDRYVERKTRGPFARLPHPPSLYPGLMHHLRL